MTLSRDEATFREGSTPKIIFQLTKKLKNGRTEKIHLTEISTLVLDYILNSDGSTINNRSDQNVKNANNVKVSDTGEVTWTLQAADTASASSTEGALERHDAIFSWTLTSAAGSLKGNFRQQIHIETETKV